MSVARGVMTRTALALAAVIPEAMMRELTSGPRE